MSSRSDRARPVASSSNHVRPRAIALISAGSHRDLSICCASPGSTSLVSAPRRLKATAVPFAVQTGAKAPGFSPTAPEFTAETDSPLEEDGIELSVPPRRERLWDNPDKHCYIGPLACRWLHQSCRRLRLAMPRRAFRRSWTDGSNPVPSTGESYELAGRDRYRFTARQQ